MGDYEDYKELSEKAADRELGEFPRIDAAEYEAKVNELFKPYLFFNRNRHGDVAYWCSACRGSGTVAYPQRTLTQQLASVLWARHNEKGWCPLCGRAMKMKQVGKLGKRSNLLEYHPVVFLSERDGDLFARAYWARKDYQADLTASPMFMLAGAYRFRPGEARFYFENYGKVAVNVLKDNYDPVHRVITEPFTEGGWMMMRYVPYTVFGLESIGRSAFKYCQYEKFEPGGEDGKREDMMKYLAASCIYPRQIEMLMKTGMEILVEELVSGRRKNAKIIKWGEEDPCKAFGLTKEELRAWRASGAPLQAIAWYKELKRKKLPESFETLKNIEEELPFSTEAFLNLCKKYGLRPSRVCRYFTNFDGGCCGARYGVPGLQPVYQHWQDHLTMAAALGYDMKAEPVLLPHDLYGRHDEEARELARMQEQKMEERNAMKLAQRKLDLEKRKEKYNIEAGGYILRVAESAEEIVKEGIDLQHCVGGYASRHMDGVLTILFLRTAEEPDRSLYTIEMQGNNLIQIHGYQNERDGAPNPRKTMAWLLDPWLKWVGKGSRREQDGRPKGLNIKIKVEAA